MRLLSTSKITNEVAKYKNNANEVAKEENDGKYGYEAQAQWQRSS